MGERNDEWIITIAEWGDCMIAESGWGGVELLGICKTTYQKRGWRKTTRFKSKSVPVKSGSVRRIHGQRILERSVPSLGRQQHDIRQPVQEGFCQSTYFYSIQSLMVVPRLHCSSVGLNRVRALGNRKEKRRGLSPGGRFPPSSIHQVILHSPLWVTTGVFMTFPVPLRQWFPNWGPWPPRGPWGYCRGAMPVDLWNVCARRSIQSIQNSCELNCRILWTSSTFLLL